MHESLCISSWPLLYGPSLLQNSTQDKTRKDACRLSLQAAVCSFHSSGVRTTEEVLHKDRLLSVRFRLWLAVGGLPSLSQKHRRSRSMAVDRCLLCLQHSWVAQQGLWIESYKLHPPHWCCYSERPTFARALRYNKWRCHYIPLMMMMGLHKSEKNIFSFLRRGACFSSCRPLFLLLVEAFALFPYRFGARPFFRPINWFWPLFVRGLFLFRPHQFSHPFRYTRTEK